MIETTIAIIAAISAALAIILLVRAFETLRAAEAAAISATELAVTAKVLASRASSLADRASAKLAAFSVDDRSDSCPSKYP